ncbi:MAG: TetR/AcrR family transcriptional regulator [Clostridia bacterium]|nr:TetR/AcrR family transcriptional regulator [Clostridia bacterium]
MSRTAIQEKILANARRLFNEQGYAKVTMRQIADALGISVGNLTYHFPRKKDIAFALMDDTFEHIRPNDPIRSLRQIHDLFSSMLDTLTHNAFFFLDDDFSENDRHRLHNGYLREQLIAGLNGLAKAGLFLPSFTPDVCQTLVTLLLMTHLTWLHQTLRGAAPYAMSKEAFLQAHWFILRPYLSEKGLAEYRQLV